MPADVIQAKYETLEKLAQRFSERGDSCHTLYRLVQASMRGLKGGGWQGKGSAAFYAEMEEEVLPAMVRLTQALSAGAAATMQVAELIRQAEEEAARPFMNGSAATGAAGTAVSASGVGPAGAGQMFGFGPNKSKSSSAAAAAAKAVRRVKAGFPQADRNLHPATPKEIRAIENMVLEANAIHQKEGMSEAFKKKMTEAARAAANAYGIDLTNVRAINFDPTLPKEGDTNSSRGIRIGLAAYGEKDGTISVPELAATVLHEATHADQYVAHQQFGRSVDVFTRNDHHPSKQLSFVDEVEAYTVVKRNADTLGLSQALRADYQKRINDQYLAKLLPRPRALVDKGDFEGARKLIDPGR